LWREPNQNTLGGVANASKNKVKKERTGVPNEKDNQGSPPQKKRKRPFVHLLEQKKKRKRGARHEAKKTASHFKGQSGVSFNTHRGWVGGKKFTRGMVKNSGEVGGAPRTSATCGGGKKKKFDLIGIQLRNSFLRQGATSARVGGGKAQLKGTCPREPEISARIAMGGKETSVDGTI